MADDRPELIDKQLPWYRGLTRYQWWILAVATMGWMFDTMDQQFFNLGRGPAMQEVLDYDAIGKGLDELGEQAGKREYTAADLDGLVAAGLLTAEQKEQGLRDSTGQTRASLTRKQVAQLIGDTILQPKYIEIGEEKLAESPGESFDKAGLDKLIADEVLSTEWVEKEVPSGQISRDELARSLGKNQADVNASEAGAHATMIFVMGWAVGGLFFGWIGDRLGRAKTMALTILVYACFTGLNGLAQTQMQFVIFRFLTALGVGGEFAAGAALVAETMPDRSRPAALGTLQALSAVGNMTGAGLAFFVMPVLGWRWLFAFGAIPGLVAVIVFLGVREPEKWRQARARAKEAKDRGVRILESYAGLFAHPRWRKNAIVGMLLGVVGVGGLWGVGFFTPELMRIVVGQDASPEYKEKVVAITFMLQQLGAFFGMVAYTVISLKLGRRAAFAVFFVIAFAAMSYTFLFLDTELEAYYLLPLVGFVTLGPFGGYAIYFPELFPTRLRATGTGFCYNVGRFLAALVPSVKGWLTGLFNNGTLMAMIPLLSFLSASVNNAEKSARYASVVMIFIYIVGLFVLLFAPETKGKPLPEE